MTTPSLVVFPSLYGMDDNLIFFKVFLFIPWALRIVNLLSI